MIRIRDIVQQALAMGYLTVEAEDQLRDLLSAKYDLEDLNAFMTLQHASMSGRIKQQSRLLRYKTTGEERINPVSRQAG
ncbi:hypothetical protein [Laspinema palackyanum]|uniref:Uncharacterized protein n=1 Tax=Laspinema palackyanum D2a TaxID=2953684 RepID=A0ABT2MMU1_9CYAN|nr:hypothetical protein [Laspinema sp. D2c]MCT7960692.1 hypothetical protein [Laspinema sp. D2b]MCT7964851.1 hypothetical protein [Laspinema sp. D2a]